MTHPIPDEALDEDIAILGRKGGGKSYTAKGIVERLLDMGRRVLVLDPLGVWAGLRTSADGAHAGYPVAIFGGLHGDLPLDPAAAEPLARIIAAENLPAVIDLSELSKSAQQAFLLKFLHELRRANHDALTVVLEEADVFAPQNPQGDDSKALHAEIDWIARRGRFKGFRLLTITQRPARLSKDVLTQANMVIMHRLPAPQDREAAKAWVDGNGDRDQAKVVFDTLAGLKVGEAWVLAQEPAMLERAVFPHIKTLDTSATPKAGETRIEPKTLAQVDVSAIRDALEVPADDAEKPATKTSKADLDAAMERGYQRGLAEGIERGRREMASEAIARVREALLALGTGLAIIPANELPEAPEARTAPPDVPATQVATAPKKAAQRPPAQPRAASSSLPASVARCLDAIAWWRAFGFDEVSRDRAAIIAGLSPTASTFGVYIGKLKALGLVDTSTPGHLRLTEEGLMAATAPEHVDPADVLRHAQKHLSNQGARVLQLIAGAYPSPIDRGTLADQMGLSRTASTLGVYIGEGSRLGFIETAGPGMVIAAEWLFPRRAGAGRRVNSGDTAP